MSDKKNLTVPVPADTYNRFEEYRNERDISKADAGRRLLEDALDSPDDDTSRRELAIRQRSIMRNQHLLAAIIAAMVVAIGAAMAGLYPAWALMPMGASWAVFAYWKTARDVPGSRSAKIAEWVGYESDRPLPSRPILKYEEGRFR